MIWNVTRTNLERIKFRTSSEQAQYKTPSRPLSTYGYVVFHPSVPARAMGSNQ